LGRDDAAFLEFVAAFAAGFGDEVAFLDFAGDLADDLAQEPASAFLHPLPTIHEHCELAKHGCFLRIEHMI
jgi:hypothetical protein